MTCLCRFFSYPSHPATDCASCERLYTLVMFGFTLQYGFLAKWGHIVKTMQEFLLGMSLSVTWGRYDSTALGTRAVE